MSRHNPMQKFIFYFVLIFITALVNLIHSQNSTVIIPPSNIKSIQLKPIKNDSYSPIIALGEKLELSFDDLDSDQKLYSYKIEHCDYDWNISNIASTEFMTGYAEDRIREYENSFNTLQDYTHYEIQIPNQNNRIKISGNYLISVIDEDDTVVFNRRFIVYQPLVQVGVTAHRTTNIASIFEKHSIQFSINHQNLFLNNPKEEIKVAIYQNTAWNTVVKDIPPKYIRGSQLLYNYVDEISFWAGNEFLYFDTKEIRNATNNIAKTRLEDIFNTYLYIDESRGNKPYTFYPDVNGNFVFRTIDSEDIDLEADYSLVHFSLENSSELENESVYIYGSFNDWQLTDENKMIYNSRSKLYEASILFKQGFYNYTYVTANEKGLLNNHEIEGSYYQTENDYTVIVYYKKFGDLYDQVVGVGSGNSEKLQN